MWLQELQKKTKGDPYWSGISVFRSKDSTVSLCENIVCTYEDVELVKESDWRSISESSTQQTPAEHEFEKHALNEIEFIDKSVIKDDLPPEIQDKEIVVGFSFQTPVPDNNEDDDEDAWVKDDTDLIGYTSTSVVVDEEDISFSDLEDDFDSDSPNKFKTFSTERNKAAKIS